LVPHVVYLRSDVCPPRAVMLHELGHVYDPTPAQHRATCSLLKRAARDRTPPASEPAPPVVTEDPAPAAAPPVAPTVVPGRPRPRSRPGTGGILERGGDRHAGRIAALDEHCDPDDRVAVADTGRDPGPGPTGDTDRGAHPRSHGDPHRHAHCGADATEEPTPAAR
jgi:hypothetical protein